MSFYPLSLLLKRNRYEGYLSFNRRLEMKRYLMILAWLFAGILILASQGWAVCPEDTVDSGICDTMYVELYGPDQNPVGPPSLVRFPIFVTHDVPNENIDSIAAFVIPLCYTHTNPSKFCSVSAYWNNILFSPPSFVERSIFRHIIEGPDTVYHNWMMDQYQKDPDLIWDSRVLSLDGTSHAWLALLEGSAEAQRFGSGSRVLLATLTFRMEDSMTICLDSCFWPPSSNLGFCRSDAKGYIPRHFLPQCEWIGHPVGYPYFYICPRTDTCFENGEFVSQTFDIRHTDSVVTEVTCSFSGHGVENVRLVNLSGLGTSHVTGKVAYTVVDHTQDGGMVTITARDDANHYANCSFRIALKSACVQAPNDNGICDSMYVEVWPDDHYFPGSGPVRFPIYVTHDVQNPVDSIAAFVIPLCYTHTNSTKYCSLSSYWNTGSFTPPGVNRSIFRHLPSMSTPLVHNWMMDRYQAGNEEEWNSIILSLDGISHFWLSLIPSGTEDQKFGPGRRVLLATMTFRLQDTMMVCIDSCFWPPSSRLAFARLDAMTYIPRHNLPACQKFIICANCPPIISCPGNQTRFTNGHYYGGEFVANDCSGCAMLTSVRASFQGAGVENVHIVYMNPPPSEMVMGYVEYDVTDRCKPGGTVTLVVEDEYGATDTCFFGINIWNNPPALSVPDSIFALADHISGFPVSAEDADNDPVSTAMNAFWFVQDSLKAPVNSPSYSGNNPGYFSWVPTVSDSGRWIASFSATDTCGKADTSQTTILVGMTSCGDCTNDSLIDVGDVVYLINYLFRGGTAPDPVCQGDVNCSGLADIGDVILLINYLYKGGTAPCFGCCG